MTDTDTELARRAEVFGCGRGLDLLERIRATPDGIGTAEVSAILGLRSDKGIGPRLRATRTEVASHGIRFEHAVVREPSVTGSGSTWRAGPRIDHALHILRRTRKRIEQPSDRPRDPLDPPSAPALATEWTTTTVRTPTLAPAGTNLSPRLERNIRGRDLVVGDVHGHFATLRRALAELEVGEHDRVLSLGDLVDRGPDSFQAKSWMEGSDPSARFDLVLRGNHEQMMLEALVEGPPRHRGLWDANGNGHAWSLWELNGGGWWNARKPGHSANAWIGLLKGLPWCAAVETASGPVGLVHACPVHARWQDLEERVRGNEVLSHLTRDRALWSRVRHGHLQREIGETGDEHLGPVAGVRAVVTGHTPVREPTWHENVLAVDTGVHIEERGYGRLTIARIDGKEIETSTFAR